MKMIQRLLQVEFQHCLDSALVRYKTTCFSDRSQHLAIDLQRLRNTCNIDETRRIAVTSDKRFGMATVVDGEYWRQLWVNGDTGWHTPEVNKTLAKYVDDMTAGQKICRIFVPLCGKSEDMKWLADRGHTVVGAELSSLAIEDFFKENNIEFTSGPVDGLPDMELYTSKDSSILVYKGNLFDLTRDIMGEFDCIWDRGSLVALLRKDIQRYADLMTSILKPKGKCLLETFEYDQSKMQGPPFSTPAKTVEQLYATDLDIKPLEEHDWLGDILRKMGLDALTALSFLLTKKEKI